MRYIWTIIMAPVVVLLTLAVSLGICVSGIVDRTGWIWWRIGRFWGWSIMRLCGATSGIRTRNIERMQDLKGAILMANHESNLDPPLLIGLSKAPVRFVTKHSLFYIPIFGQAMWVVGMIPVDRTRRERAIDSLKEAADKIAEGRVVLVFPEGQRSRGSDLLKFKKGGFMLALQSGVPIVPIGIAGTGAIMPPGYGAIRFGAAAVSVGDPICTEGMDISNRKEIMDKVEAAIRVERAHAQALLQAP